MAKPARRSTRGFTLVELAVVVVIVGVVAAIGAVTYSKYKRSAGVAEATNMVGTIRAAQEHYFGEKGSYADISANLTTFYPATPAPKKKTQWGAACGAMCKNGKSWNDLGVQADSPVYFGYATVAGNSSTSPSTRSASTTITPPTGAVDFDGYYNISKKNWYIVHAKADHGDSVTTRVMSSSWSNQLFVEGLQ